jgi:protein gp37
MLEDRNSLIDKPIIMASKIEWTEDTWNPIIGCDKVSAGCKNCYAIQTAWIRMHNPAMKDKYAGTVEKTAAGKLNWTGKVNMHEPSLLKPLKTRKPTVFFVNSMSDLFHDEVPFEFVRTLFGIMAVCKDHTFQILTKRPQRMQAFFDWLKEIDPEMMDDPANYAYDLCTEYGIETGCGSAFITESWPLENVWLGVSVEDQEAANERIPYLNSIPAAVKFLSCEPLLGPVNLRKALEDSLKYHAGGLKNCISWVIVGGESGHGARPMNPDWARSLRDQCHQAGIPFLFKQWGNWKYAGGNSRKENIGAWEGAKRPTIGMDAGENDGVYVMVNVGKKAAGRVLDGQTYDQFPTTIN